MEFPMMADIFFNISPRTVNLLSRQNKKKNCTKQVDVFAKKVKKKSDQTSIHMKK